MPGDRWTAEYHTPNYNQRGSISRNSRDDRRPEERRSDERPSHPSPINAPARLPSGAPRRSNSMTRPSPSNQERPSSVLGLKPGTGNNSTERAPDQITSPAVRQTMDLPTPNAAASGGKSPSTQAYEEVFACLRDFTKQVTENTKLSFEQDKAERFFRQKAENLKKSASHHTNYVQIFEQQKKGQDDAKQHLDEIKQRAVAKRDEMTTTMKSLASRIVHGGVDTGAIDRNLQKVQDQLNDLEKRVNSESSAARNSITALSQDLQRNYPNSEVLKRELLIVQNDVSNVKSMVANSGARMDVEVSKIRGDVFNTRDGLQSAQSEINQLKSQLDSIGQDVKLAREEHKVVDQEVQQVKRNDSKWEQNHKLVQGLEASIRAIESRPQNPEISKSEVLALSRRISAVEDKTAKLNAGDQKRITDDIAGFRRRVEALESRPPRAQSVTSSTARSGSAVATASEEYSSRIGELSSNIAELKSDFAQMQTNLQERFDRFQEDNDDIYGNGIDRIDKQVTLLNNKLASMTSSMEAVVAKTTLLESSFSGLKELHNDNVRGLQANQQAQNDLVSKLGKEVQALKVATRPMELSSNYPQNPTTGYARPINSPVVSNVPVPGRQSGSPVVNSSDLAQSNLKALTNQVDAATMAVTNLASRFNLITTDNLARQMWSQLDNVHPHLKDATKGLVDMSHKIQGLEAKVDKQLLQLQQRFHPIEAQFQTLPNLQHRVGLLEQRGLPSSLKDALETVDRNVTELKNKVEEAEVFGRNLQNQIDIMVKNSTNATTNGTGRGDGSSSDSGQVKRKAPDATNGNAKRPKISSRRIVNDTDDEESQGNGNSDALSPTTR